MWIFCGLLKPTTDTGLSVESWTVFMSFHLQYIVET